MRKQWKTLENTRRAPPVSRLARWFITNENRGFIGWFASLIGIAFVIAYQMTLEIGFTPQVSLTEGAFVLGKAALVGVLLLAAIYACIYAPASSLRILEIDIDQFTGPQRKAIIVSLMRRCLAAHVFGASLLLAFVFFSNASREYHFYAATIASLICVGSLVAAFSTRRLGDEGQWKFVFTIGVIGMLAAWSLLLFASLVGIKDDPVSLIHVSLAWSALALISSVVSISRKKDILLSCGVSLLFMMCILAMLGQFPRSLKAIATSVGIAHDGNMTLIVPAGVCGQIRSALSGFDDVQCTGDAAGVLRNVEVLNSWGSRWLIQLRRQGAKRIISFEGNGVVMLKEPVAKPGPGA